MSSNPALDAPRCESILAPAILKDFPKLEVISFDFISCFYRVFLEKNPNS
jgi:hypothetical protein